MRFASLFRSIVAVVASITLLLVAPFTMADLSGGLSERTMQMIQSKYGRSARKRVEEWQDLMRSGSSLNEAEKLEVVNSFFNDVEFISDIDHWDKEDYWATPVEMLATDGGDCEDFSIAKYFTLKEMGVPVERMLITYVKALELDQAHMVLTYYKTPNSEPLVLDNLINSIKPASARDDLKPVYSFNADGLWLSKQRGLGKRVGSSDRLNLWKILRQRMEQELAN